MACIYKIINQINNKVYIGQTMSSLKVRWNGHKTAWRQSGNCKALYSAFDKYGIENFTIEPIEECDLDNINEREKYWIKHYNSYNNGYNMTLGGDGNIKLDYELIYNLWDSGLTTTEIGELIGSTQAGVQKVLTGYPNYSVKEAKHRSAKNSGITKGKPIQQLAKDGTLIDTFPNATVAAESLGMGRSESNNIRACAHGRRQTAYGYVWKFVNKEDLYNG